MSIVRIVKGGETIAATSRGQDLNLRPSGHEPDELPDCCHPARFFLDLPLPLKRGRNKIQSSRFFWKGSYLGIKFPNGPDGSRTRVQKLYSNAILYAVCKIKTVTGL